MTNPSRVAFTLFGRDIYWYGVLIAVAVMIGITISYRRSERYGVKQDDLIDFAIWAIPVSVIFARLYYVVFEWDMFRGDLLKIVRLWEGGLAIYGAVIGGVLTGVLFCRRRKISFWSLADIVTPALVLGQAIGRWGNFFNQEAYGIAVTNPAHMWFPMAVRIDATNTIHYATFFYESMWCFLIFAFIMLMGKRFKHRGDCFLWYVTLYALERALVEGLRTDSLYLGDVRVSQLLSALLFVAGITYIIWRHLKEKRTGVLVGAPPYFAQSPRDADTALMAESSEPAADSELEVKSEVELEAEPVAEPDRQDEPERETGDSNEGGESDPNEP
jgi:phosphatidylglycerol:prolipoprotein diacylglycerol transferase